MNEIFAPDFFEIGRSGRIHSRDICINTEVGPFDTQLPLPDFEVRLISAEVAQVTYNSIVTIGGNVIHGRRSSIWSRQSGRWSLRFHQGTLCGSEP